MEICSVEQVCTGDVKWDTFRDSVLHYSIDTDTDLQKERLSLYIRAVRTVDLRGFFPLRTTISGFDNIAEIFPSVVHITGLSRTRQRTVSSDAAFCWQDTVDVTVGVSQLDMEMGSPEEILNLTVTHLEEELTWIHAVYEQSLSALPDLLERDLNHLDMEAAGDLGPIEILYLLRIRTNALPIPQLTVALDTPHTTLEALAEICEACNGGLRQLHIVDDYGDCAIPISVLLSDFAWNRFGGLRRLQIPVRIGRINNGYHVCTASLCENYDEGAETLYPADPYCNKHYQIMRCQSAYQGGPIGLDAFHIRLYSEFHEYGHYKSGKTIAEVLPLIRVLAEALLAIGGTTCYYTVSLSTEGEPQSDALKAQESMYNTAVRREIDALIEDQALPQGWRKLPKEGASLVSMEGGVDVDPMIRETIQ